MRPSLRRTGALRRVLVAGALGAGLMSLAIAPASAVDGTIDYVEPTSGGLRILVSVPPDAEVDLDGVRVTVGGADATAEAVEGDSQTLVRRTAVLAIDTSNSMRGARFRAAKQAAKTYLDAVPDDVYVGIVGFADEVIPVLRPTQDRRQARELLAGLALSRKTRLYDGVLAGSRDGRRRGTAFPAGPLRRRRHQRHPGGGRDHRRDRQRGARRRGGPGAGRPRPRRARGHRHAPASAR